jgi:hypothetical protein
MHPKDAAIRKRTQIATANRTMFLWVAAVSVLFGFAAVATIFLSQMMIFNEKVLSKKDQTIKILKDNNTNVKELESQIRALDADQALIDSKANADDNAVQVILDALPSDSNWEALGASIRDRLLAGINNLTINSIDFDDEGASISSSQVVNASSSVSASTEMGFRFSVTGNGTALKQVLNNIEKSIRTIDVTSLKFEVQDGDTIIMSIKGRAFYEPIKEVKLVETTVR